MNNPVLFCLIFYVLVSSIIAQVCYDDGNEFCLNEEDILAVDLLPGSFVLAGESEGESRVETVKNFTSDGSFKKAFNEMGYHRQRMNEYLCHGYIAEEIFNEVGPVRMKRRLESSPENVLSDFLDEDNVTVHDKLLSDEGSSKYKDWLQRTTTLNDVYQHYAPRKKIKNKYTVHPEDDFDDFDGEITGYAVPVPMSSEKDQMIMSSAGQHASYGPPNYGPSSSGPSSHGFPPAFHEEYYYFPANHHHEEKHIYHNKKGNELSIKDFFEIALTALAFLSFGLFIIQLLMNCANAMTATTAPATTSIFADLSVNGNRKKRNILDSLPLAYSGNSELNELSHRVLRSIEAALVAQHDSGNCLRKVLCEDNRHAKSMKGGQRIWVPVWSLGMSWVSGRILNKSPWSAMLNSVKASVLGLGDADCDSLYPQCNLERERIKRRRRRRK